MAIASPQARDVSCPGACKPEEHGFQSLFANTTASHAGHKEAAASQIAAGAKPPRRSDYVPPEKRAPRSRPDLTTGLPLNPAAALVGQQVDSTSRPIKQAFDPTAVDGTASPMPGTLGEQIVPVAENSPTALAGVAPGMADVTDAEAFPGLLSASDPADQEMDSQPATANESSLAAQGGGPGAELPPGSLGEVGATKLAAKLETTVLSQLGKADLERIKNSGRPPTAGLTPMRKSGFAVAATPAAIKTPSLQDGSAEQSRLQTPVTLSTSPALQELPSAQGRWTMLAGGWEGSAQAEKQPTGDPLAVPNAEALVEGTTRGSQAKAARSESGPSPEPLARTLTEGAPFGWLQAEGPALDPTGPTKTKLPGERADEIDGSPAGAAALGILAPATPRQSQPVPRNEQTGTTHPSVSSPPSVVEPVPLQAAHLLQRINKAELRIGLQSEYFGEIQLHTTMAKDQVGASVSTSHDALHEALLVEAPSLEKAMARQNLRLDSVSIGTATSGSSNSSSFAGDRRAARDDLVHSAWRPPPAQPPAGLVPTPAAATLGDRGLDIRV